MYPIYFDAVLKAEGGKIMEPGEAAISQEDNSVTFKSDFVPLIPLDETVEIIRTLGEKQFEAFSGSVYLSSRNLLQITSVNDAPMQSARRLFDINVNIPVSITVSPDSSPRFNIKKADQTVGNIRFVSENEIKITAMQFMGEGHYLYLNCEQPVVLKKTLVRIEERILLGKKSALSLCKIISQPKEEAAALQSYIEHLKKHPDKENY